jgi:hypothetical protein
MAIFTVIGFWPDTQQRFATHVIASGSVEAEKTCLQRNRGVAICGVVSGLHNCADKTTRVSYGLREDVGLTEHD